MATKPSAVPPRVHLAVDGGDDPAAETPPPAAPAGGQLEASVRVKFSALDTDYEADPLAVHILAMARTLDVPGSVAPGSLTGMGKAFRDAYKEYLRENEDASAKDDPVSNAKNEAAAKLAMLSVVA